MSITQQYLLDSYRASQHGEAAPPAPGSHDREVARELRDYRRFRAVVAGHPAHGRLRGALSRWLHGRHRWPARR
ncbi:hypothetical protein OG410_23415 [Streptomyces sp. NBC_00659]|jgi:hypothetical protein|uniref:hypothetical protein n=1 Tax=unclassified Streptomyces TaxID=2593676 RepID=UPI002E1C34DC|nr:MULTISPECIES: hypothetical protein [unclassified Streptomyces]